MKARYAFLVHAASVHHWWSVRPFLKEGSRKLAIPSLTRICEALDAAADADTKWRARNWLALALSHVRSRGRVCLCSHVVSPAMFTVDLHSLVSCSIHHSVTFLQHS